MPCKNKIAVGFIVPPEGAIGGSPYSEKWFSEKKQKVLDKLHTMFPDIKFVTYDIRNVNDVSDFLDRESDSIGYLIFILNCIAGLIRPILYSGKPVIMIGETYGGSGEFLLEYSSAKEEGRPVLGVVTRNIDDERVLGKVRLFKVIYKLRNSKILFIVSPAERLLMNLEYPLSVDLYSSIKALQTVSGITPILLDVREFVKKYYQHVDEGEAKKVAEKWVKNAMRNYEEDNEEIVKSAKLYLAMRNAIKDYEANAIAVDCIVLYNSGFLDAWPCLGYMELWYDGIVPICEADAYSAFSLLAMRYLADRPGFISDPSPDNLKDEVVYYHCYSPTCPYGVAGKTCPYTITPAHLGSKHASVFVELPINEEITVVGFIPEERVLTLHTAKAVSNEFSSYACATKLVGRTNTCALINNWRKRAGWHRVVFYGNWREELKDLATLLGLKVIEEDK